MKENKVKISKEKLEKVLSNFGKVCWEDDDLVCIECNPPISVRIEEDGLWVSFVFEIPEHLVKQFEDFVGLEETKWSIEILDAWIDYVVKKIVNMIKEKLPFVEDWDFMDARSIVLYYDEPFSSISEVGKTIEDIVEEVTDIVYNKLELMNIIDFISPAEMRKVLIPIILDDVMFVSPCEIKKIGGSYGVIVPLDGLKLVVDKLEEKIPAILRVEPKRKEIIIKLQ